MKKQEKMQVSKLLLTVCLATASVSGWAQVSVQINVPGLVQVAPPPPRYEASPRLQPDQIWVPGRWEWTGREYVWQRGHSERARADYVYAPGRWVPADGGWRWSDEKWSKKTKRVKAYQHDQRYSNHDRDEGGGGHCPPGQAKKGRC